MIVMSLQKGSLPLMSTLELHSSFKLIFDPLDEYLLFPKRHNIVNVNAYITIFLDTENTSGMSLCNSRIIT